MSGKKDTKALKAASDAVKANFPHHTFSKNLDNGHVTSAHHTSRASAQIWVDEARDKGHMTAIQAVHPSVPPEVAQAMRMNIHHNF